MMNFSRRTIITGACSLAFAGLLKGLYDKSFSLSNNTVTGYGLLQPDLAEILELPDGFSYQVISELGDPMDDGYFVPGRADGMGCFALDGSKVALVRNHEVGIDNNDPEMSELERPLLPFAYDHTDDGVPISGGTTTIIYDLKKKTRIEEYRSLIGTARNCAGGITPWGTWLTCEEIVVSAGEYAQYDHGWVFEVPVKGERIRKAVPLKGMGRFNHEAAAVDPRTGIVYLTEDRSNSLFYRFIPNVYGELDKGGKLQALGFVGAEDGFDSRNWDGITFEQGSWRDANWIDIEDIESPNDDLRVHGYKNGAVVFARGEGIIWGNNELYFCCTSGGDENMGQVMRYVPSLNEGRTGEEKTPGKLQLFFESVEKDTFGLGDNLTVAPNGHLIVCEDHYDGTKNHMRGITPDGEVYTLAKLLIESETAGACFSPDGNTLFVNVQRPTKTLAITGPWDQFKI
ncbi:MAG: DUF839 domain-containing protein [Emcibacteraceae bacterium]|nr:DUF839 domain-containing protein [Emcibacteraceae bacterium]MDG1857819.1 DUF839 domain-containing protein [Emcibacteraceae bacterium]